MTVRATLWNGSSILTWIAMSLLVTGHIIEHGTSISDEEVGSTWGLLACKLAACPKQRELKATKSRMAMANTLLCSNNKEQTHFLPYPLKERRASVTLARPAAFLFQNHEEAWVFRTGCLPGRHSITWKRLILTSSISFHWTQRRLIFKSFSN